MPPHEVARLGREVLSALRAAHAVGIQHRDVKPANVLLREDGRSVLTDFGIAAVRESTSLTATGSFIGSPEYMAPERINGVEGDPASDFWSLGMMLYVAVEGRHPLRRSTTLATLAAVLNQEVPPPERAGALTPVLSALLRREPAARPDADTLDRMLASAADPGATPPPMPAAPTPAMPGPHAQGPAPMGPAMGPAMGRMAGRPGPPMGGQTMPPGYGHAPQQPPWGPAPIPKATTVHSRRRRGGGRTVGIVTSAVAVTVAGVLVWQLVPSMSRSTTKKDPSARSTSEEVTDPESPDASTPATPGNLHTAAGMRALIAKIKNELGDTKVVRMTVYPTYASIEAPLQRDKELYDTYFYRDGEITRSSAGGRVSTPVVDLQKYNWTALPALLRKANKDLGVPKPTSRYLIVDPDYAFATPRQVLLVYASDDYRSGYLVANLQGKVVKVYASD
jgi:serine/threonine protein kinase